MTSIRRILVAVLAALPAPVLAQAPPKPPVEPLPAKPPAWVAGYKFRWTLRLATDPAKEKARSVIAILPTGGWLRPDATDVVVQTADGKTQPAAVLAHDPAGDTVIQFARPEKETWFWAYGAGPPGPKATPIQEGLTVEVRQWAGDDLDSWATVRDGLKKSETVIGTGVVGEIVQRANPANPDLPRKFAASYRGFLTIPKDGVYRFWANGDDACFLFIDGNKASEKLGTGPRVRGAIPTRSVGTDVELKAGVHPVEVHHVVGENAASEGVCNLLWVPPGGKAWEFVGRPNFVQAAAATVAAVEEARGAAPAVFAAGIEDVLTSGTGTTIYLVRFEAQAPNAPDTCVWDFGDGTTAKGKSAYHVYFKPGNFPVTLKATADQPAFKRLVAVYAAPVASSPFTLGKAVKSLAAEDWSKPDPDRLTQAVEFLTASEQPDRWAALDRLAAALLTQDDLEPKTRATLVATRVQALGELGKVAEATKLGTEALPKLKELPSLAVGIQLALADVQFRQARDLPAAAKLYDEIIEEHRRLDHPGVRVAAIRRGDLLAEAGDLTKAAEAYRLAATLGGDKFKASAGTDPVRRGALLRIAEQKLRAGDARQGKQLLEKIELDFPEQKVEGLYRFLRAEADRVGGRYEEAVRGYEMLLKSANWTGYRDRALFGLADAHARAGRPARAVEWLDALKESYPRSYEKFKADEYRKGVEARAKAGDKKTLDVWQTGFEPTDPDGFGEPMGWPVVRGLGLRGPHVGLTAHLPWYAAYIEFNWKRVIKDVEPGREYWVEVWVRNTFDSAPGQQGAHNHMHVYLQTPDGKATPEGGMGTIYYEPTRGRWQKLGFRVRAPQTTESQVYFTLRHTQGVVEIDDLSIRPIADRDRDALTNFVEGVDRP